MSASASPARSARGVPTRQAGASDGVWVGVDIGTQSVRAIAVTRFGQVLGSATQALSSHRDGPRHEQDPGQWWQAVGAALRQALREVPAASVRGVAVDATSGTVLLVDPAGRPLTPALMYDDARAAGEVARVNEAGHELWAELGYQRMQPVWALPKLVWLLGEYPQLAATARLAHQNDFVNRQLVGHEVPTDLSNALKTGAHLIEEIWPTAVFDKLGIAARLLPDLVRPGTVLGTVCPAAGEHTGLPVGTPVISGTTDGCAAQLGAGALRVGSWNSVLGTTLVLKGVTRELIHDPLGVVYSHKAPNGDWLPGGASSTGAGVLSRDFAGLDLEELNRQAGEHEPARRLSYPLVSQGERFPFVAPQARGFVLDDLHAGAARAVGAGAGAGDELADRYAAVLQGVGYIERLCFDYLDLLGARADGEVILTGGATRSAYWCQLRADILGRPITLPQNAEPALGMAVLAASPGRAAADVAAEMVQVRDVIDPRPGCAERYAPPYLRLVGELEHRGWLQPAAARHARERTAR